MIRKIIKIKRRKMWISPDMSVLQALKKWLNTANEVDIQLTQLLSFGGTKNVVG